MRRPQSLIIIVISTLVISLVVLTFSAVATSTVSAGLGCWNVRNCSGDAGCAFGSVEGCVITCSSGSIIYCNRLKELL